MLYNINMNEYYNIDDIIKIDNEYYNKFDEYEYEEYCHFNNFCNTSYDEFIRIKYNIDGKYNDIYYDIYNDIYHKEK